MICGAFLAAIAIEFPLVYVQPILFVPLRETHCNHSGARKSVMRVGCGSTREPARS